MEKDETAQLECGVDAKPTVNSVKWTRNGRFIDTHFKHTIPRVTLQDSGTYVCSADNGLGQVTYSPDNKTAVLENIKVRLLFMRLMQNYVV